MLQSLRDRMSGIVAWFIVGLLIIPFAFFGIDQFAGGSPDPKVATVGDEDITLTGFRNAYSQRYQMLLQQLGDDFDASMLDQSAFRRAVLDELIRESAQTQYAERGGWRVTDAEIMHFLRTVPAFQEDGRFSPSRYRSLLARQGMSPARYEEQLRQGLRVEQVRAAVVDSAFATPQEIQQARALREQQRSFDVVRVPVSRFLGDIEPDEAAVAGHYEANREAWRVPERTRLAWLEVNAEEIAAAHDAPDEPVLRELYEVEAESRFRRPERRRVRHILLTGDDAGERIQDVAAQMSEGASFADLAEALSDDPGSASQGGDLGWIERGQMVPEFDEAAFSLGADELSEPVRSEFGWHLVRVDEVSSSEVRPFEDEEVQETLTRIYRQRATDMAYREALAQLEQLTFEHAGALEPAAEAIGAEVHETDWLERGSNRDILALPGVASAAFSEMVRAGENSSPISVSSGRVIVLRQIEHEPSRIRTLDEVRSRVSGELREVEGRRRAQELAEEIVFRARDGQTLEEITGRLGNLEVRSLQDLARDSDAIDGEVVRRAFAMPRPAGDGDTAPTLATADLGDRGVAVIQLNRVALPEPDDNEAAGFLLARRTSGTIANAEFLAFQQHINDQIRVRIRRPLDEVEQTEGDIYQ